MLNTQELYIHYVLIPMLGRLLKNSKKIVAACMRNMAGNHADSVAILAETKPKLIKKIKFRKTSFSVCTCE